MRGALTDLDALCEVLRVEEQVTDQLAISVRVPGATQGPGEQEVVGLGRRAEQACTILGDLSGDLQAKLLRVLQEREFEMENSGYTATRHQREVGAGYFDQVSQVISGGLSSTLALEGSTEEDQFYDS